MPGIEWRAVTPNEMVRDIENQVRLYRENKYAFQTGLKDVDFDIDEQNLTNIGLPIPFQSIDQAELALRSGVISPKQLTEEDDTQHQVLIFDSRPIGYSGFMDCVTHSMALTDHGLFEVGRYLAVSLSSQSRNWKWFLHRRLATTLEMVELQEKYDLGPVEMLEKIYQAMIGI